ncbi:SDR family NAD(P)-dependent oxidoreductase [Benzoatithermus flavus]|uniref:Dihydromonapterin reductase n=1 Tax=Benzoatithermus flavus TaxID=3108223 RepID=A0ABU8XW83_9PROT
MRPTTASSLFDDAILVTGAGRRVGLHLARRLMRSGHPVIAHYRSRTEGIDGLEQEGAVCVQADLAVNEDVERLSATVRNVARSLRAVVHNASSFAVTAADPREALVQLDLFYAVHMRAPFALNLALADLLHRCSARHADIVHITDIYADKPNPVFDAYCATKAGLQNLTLSLAKRLAPKIKVNAIQPGPILFKEWHGPEARTRVLAETPMGEEGGAEAIGLAVEAILANHYQTGAVVAVDGGRRLA